MAKGRRKAQGEENTPTGTKAPGATNHRSKEPPGDHENREKERAGATALGEGDATRTGARENTHGGGGGRLSVAWGAQSAGPGVPFAEGGGCGLGAAKACVVLSGGAGVAGAGPR